jgi:hypothetical protein
MMPGMPHPLAPPPRLAPVIVLALLVSGCTPAPPAGDRPPSAPAAPAPLWTDATAATIGATAEWTNKVELADLDGDGRIDLLFANGGNYSEPGTPEPNRVFVNRGAGARFVERTTEVLGDTPDLARVVKARDVNGDGHTDILVGTTFQARSRLYLGTGGGAFREVSATHLPQAVASVGDLEFGDVDLDGDLDVVLADWGPGHNMTNAGGRTRLWLNDGAGRFTDATAARMPVTMIRFSWDLELIDADNDADLDIIVSCKRCPGGSLFRNDGSGTFAEDARGLPAYTNNYEYEAMDLDGDGFLDLVTINDGDIVDGVSSSRREHVFRNDAKGRFTDATTQWWPLEANIGEDDNMVAFLDHDADGDADFVVGSLSGPDRLLINDGKGRLRLATGVFGGEDTPGTLALALADLDGDHRLDVVQAQGEHETAVQERVFLGTGLPPDTAAPRVAVLATAAGPAPGTRVVRARVHDGKSPTLDTEWRSVVVQFETGGGQRSAPMRWYGEYLWTAAVEARDGGDPPLRVCATDAAGNAACTAWRRPAAPGGPATR